MTDIFSEIISNVVTIFINYIIVNIKGIINFYN